MKLQKNYNVYFFIGLIGIILSSSGIKPEDLTTWTSVFDMFWGVLSNPFKLSTVFMALLGVYKDTHK